MTRWQRGQGATKSTDRRTYSIYYYNIRHFRVPV